ncbi:MAG: hypothetical protein C4516_04960 [Oxalobacter sp.]|nr:MAG: hypothetical protein C4516_04960 [Oxalobacter sp.]
MRWIEKVLWNGSCYQIKAITPKGCREELDVNALNELATKSVIADAKRIKVCSNFNSWSKVPADFYLSGMRYPKQTVCGQDVYAFETLGKQFIVPAAVLMKAVFKPINGLAKHLFSPQGLDNLMVTNIKGRECGVGFFGYPMRELGTNTKRLPSVLAALSWMYSFPSAHRMWNSVLENARRGKLSMSLPEGIVSMVMQTLLRKGKYLVVDITITCVETIEAPYDFASSHTGLIEYHKAAQTVRGAPIALKENELSHRDGIWSLSDAEWSAVEPIVSKGKMRHSLREIIDCILIKLGTGTPWNAMNFDNVKKPNVIWCHKEMREDGRWCALVKAITDTRTMLSRR